MCDGYRLWYTHPWPRRAIFVTVNMCNKERNYLCAPNNAESIRCLCPSTSLRWLAEQLPGTRTLDLDRPASFSLPEPSSPAAPLIHVHELYLNNVIPGVEHLLDGVMLPRLRSIEAEFLPLFVALVCRNDQLRSLDQVDRLVIYDDAMNACALKHWYTVLEAFPHLQQLIVYFEKTCPPFQLAHVFIEYVQRAANQRLVLFSCGLWPTGNRESKLDFIEYLESIIALLFPLRHVLRIGFSTVAVWL